ncbi:MFS general substrate transporter [Aureobasidium pullulans]|uniref:MFS general substrate transporter n=1 Tax=Aureobasidium pullulans TaxID=5580 RepID=A0A4T0E565_AURPU|nr:MFS general substrate transporter [Aureobasidium pullulans]
MAAANKRLPERRLPVQQMCVLALCRISEPIAFTSVFPYLPEMIESLGVPEDEVARWAGICVSMFPLAQFLTAVSWGRASDRYGRKPVILLSLTCTMITSLLWGFSSSLGMAIAIRVLAGAANGTVGIIRTAVAEMVPWKELQPRAFSVMPLVWNIGSIFGPTLGGALANPYHMKPGQPLPDNPTLFERFPYALPNMLAVILFLTGISIGILFLEETLAAKKDRRDYGLELGLRIKYYSKQALRKTKLIFTRADGNEDSETEPLLKPQFAPSPTSDEEFGVNTAPKPALPPPSFREVLHYQTIINLIVYTLLALHNIAFDQLIPIFMHHPVPDHSANNPDFQPPLKFAGGFGLDSGRIGFIFTLYGISGMFTQFLVFPPVARKYGVVKCLRVCAVCMPVIYFFVPFAALLPDRTSQEVAIFVLMIIKGFFSTFAFPCSTILLTNSASSLRILGTLNGIATSVGAVGRALGPAIGGSTFTYGVKIGYVILPWWVLSFIATIAAIPSFWVVEGEGFGGDADNVEDDEDSIIEEDEQEAEYGSPGPLLSRTDTISSGAISEDEREYDSDDTARDITQSPQVRSRRASSSNRLSRRPSRKMSAPIGMENRTISRRFSSNLGQSFGSAGSYDP